MTIRKLYSALVAVAVAFTVSAEAAPAVSVPADLDSLYKDHRCLEVRVFFPVNEDVLYLDYMGNEARFHKFINEANVLIQDTSYHVKSLDVLSCASPEGPIHKNNELSVGRSINFRSYIREYVDITGLTLNVISLGSNWDGLRELVADSDMPARQAVLRIIDEGPGANVANLEIDPRVGKLRELNGGTAFSYIRANLLPQLRFVDFKLVFEQTRVIVIDEPAPEPVQEPEPAPEPEVEPETVELPAYRFMMRTDDAYFPYYKLAVAARSNVLLPFANIGLEVPLGNRWSLGADHYYPWLWRYWPTRSNKYCSELMWEKLELRYWFGRDHRPGEKNYGRRLLGHSLAAAGGAGYFDFERDWHGHQGEFWFAGLDYMYAASIWNGRCHVELNLGMGYMDRTQRAYNVYVDGGKLFFDREEGETRHHYFGPINAGVTLAFPLYRRYVPRYGYYNNK